MIDCEKPGDCAYPGCECEEDNDPFNEEPAMTQQPCEQFRKYRPHVGDTIWYGGREFGTVTTVENGLCWHTGDQSGPFIWCFRDGLNALHDWRRKAGGKVTYCPGVN